MTFHKIPLFRELTKQEIDKVESLFEERSLRAGDVLFNEGEPGDALYVIRHGKMNITKRLREDAEETITILTMGPGAFLGEMALWDDARRSSTAVAVEDSKLYRLSKERFLSLLRDESAIGTKLLLNFSQTTAKRIRHVNQELAVLFEVGRTLATGSEHPDRTLTETLRVVTAGIHAERSCLWLVNPVGESIDLTASVGCDLGAFSLSLKQPSGKLSALLGIHAPQIIDATALKELSGSSEDQGWESTSNMILPIAGDDHPAAYVSLSRTQPPFSDDDLNLVQCACLQIGQFIERARLQQDMKHQTQIKREYFTI